MHTGIFRARQLSVLLFFSCAFIILLLRLFYLQVVKHTFYFNLANEQHLVTIELPPIRGTIYDRNGRVLALNLNNYSVFANPRIIKDKVAVARTLSLILKIDEEFVLERLSRNKAFVWIKRKLPQEESTALIKEKLEGIDIIKESKRFYPNGSMACHLLGAINIDNVGLEGLERYYDRYLKGQSGWLATSQDARRKILEYYQDEYVPPRDGFSLILTIDEVIQHIAERELAKAFEKYNAKGASIVVIDPKNGDILALANMPNFDLNNISARGPDAIRNRAINDFFEPGSIFKIVTASAALDTNKVRLDQRFDCESGAYKVGRRTLHDVHPYGMLTFREIIEKSSNIGTVKVASIFGAEVMFSYMKAYGFYEKTGIDLPGEVVGMNRPLSRWSPSSMLAVPMGQEVTATVMQLASAIAVIADNGYMVRPRIVKMIVDDEGQIVKEYPPKVRRRVISPHTAAKMRSLLMGVVENGTGKKAKTEEFKTGGKTGTAQKVENGTYSHGSFVASFIGFAPVEKPAVAIAVCVDEPHPIYYGGDVAAPVFRNVVDETLKYMNAKGLHRI